MQCDKECPLLDERSRADPFTDRNTANACRVTITLGDIGHVLLMMTGKFIWWLPVAIWIRDYIAVLLLYVSLLVHIASFDSFVLALAGHSN